MPCRCRRRQKVLRGRPSSPAPREDMAIEAPCTITTAMRDGVSPGTWEGPAPARVRSLSRLFRALRLGSARRPAGTNARRAVILHLDGVSRHTLEHASRAGRLPFLTRLLASGRHRLSPFLVGAPASTSAFQAGLLYGAVDDVPGYLWWDKRRNREMRMDRGPHVTEIEERHARRDPGLLAGGTSYVTLYAGGATPPIFNLGRAFSLQWNSNFRHWPLRQAAAFQGALAFKMLGRFAVDAPRFAADALAWSARVGRHEWEWRLFGMRLLGGIPLREVATWGTVGDMAIGVPVVYTCFVDYDEVAHRRGPRSREALGHLESIDACVETIHAAAAALPDHRYDVYVLADHGMTESVPFAAIDGRDLPAFLRAAVDGDIAAERHVALRHAADNLPPPLSWAVHQMARREGREPPPGMRVVDAGDIAHLYFTEDPQPLTLETMQLRHARVLAALRASPAIPLLVVRTEHGPAAVCGERVHRLDDGAGRAALAGMPLMKGRDAETLLGYLTRVISMPSAGDIVLYGNAASDTRAVAFSWEFGSHGGIAADEIESFVIHPAHVDFDFSRITLPEQLHRWFVQYRPSLPAKQDLAVDVCAPDPAERHAAFRALLDGHAYPDATPAAAAASCEDSHADERQEQEKAAPPPI